MSFLDSFTGTAGTKLKDRSGWAKIGAGWDPFSPEINASNQIRAWTDTSDVALYGQDVGNTNHYVQARVLSGFPKTGGNAYSMLNVRATGRGDSYGAVYLNGNWCLFKDNGSNMAAAAMPFTSGSLLRLEAEGSQIRLLVDGALVLTYTDTEKVTNTKVGMIAAGAPGSDPVFDDYESGLIVASTVPDAPTGVTATAGYNSVSVAFTAPANDGGKPISSYTATWSGGGTATGASSPLVISGLAAGVGGTATVTATNSVGTSAASSPSGTVVPMSQVPDAPTGVTAAAGAGYADVSFTAGDSKGLSITSFTVTASTGQTATGSASPIRVNGLAGGTPVNFTVKETTSAGTSPASVASGNVTPTTPTVKPTGVFSKVQADGDSVIIEIDTTGTPTGGTVSLPADPLTPAGAVTQAAINLAFTAGKATATFANVPVGNYAVPVASLTNGAGSNPVTGGNTVSIVGVTMPDPVVVVPPPVPVDTAINVVTGASLSVSGSTPVVTRTNVVTPPPPPPDPDPVPEPEPGATKVKMRFLTPDGMLATQAQVEIQLKESDTPDNMEGLLLPRLIQATSDDAGELEIALMPCDTPYYLTVFDGQSDAALFYKFFVPEAIGEVRLQDIIVDGRIAPSFDEAALLTIIDAKANAVAAAALAQKTLTHVGTTPPSNPLASGTWFNPETGRKYTYLMVNGTGVWAEAEASLLVSMGAAFDPATLALSAGINDVAVSTLLMEQDGAGYRITVEKLLESIGIDTTDLQVAGSLQGTDTLSVVQSDGIERKTTVAALAAYVINLVNNP